MRSHSSFSFLEVSMHKPLLLQARISRMARESNIICYPDNFKGWAIAQTLSPECIIEGNLFLGNTGIQLRIPYKTSFVFTWLKSDKKSKLAWSMSLS